VFKNGICDEGTKIEEKQKKKGGNATVEKYSIAKKSSE
jgi:hypothetical protein